MYTDLVTVIVPVYNVERYLRTCLDSIVNQSYENIEIILVNDGSTDSSLEICKSYLYDKRIRIIDKKNEGLSSARQAGIDNAQGHFICTVDSDDFLDKDFVIKMYTKICSEESHICVCATKAFSKNYTRIHGFNEDINTTHQITINDVISNYCKLLTDYYMSDSWNKIYRAEFLRKSSVRFSLSKEYNGTDLLFNHLLMLHLPKISVINEPLYNYQILENSRVRRKNKQLQKGFMIITSKIISETERLEYSELIYTQISRLYINFHREAAQDIFNSEFEPIELKEKFDEFYILNRQYLLENKKLSIDVNQVNTLSSKIFCYFLKKRSSANLFRYLRLRQKLLVLINRKFNTNSEREDLYDLHSRKSCN